MWKKVVFASFNFVFRNVQGEIEEKTRIPNQVAWLAGQDMNPGPPEYEGGMLITRL
jgi:hypothetical protein